MLKINTWMLFGFVGTLSLASVNAEQKKTAPKSNKRDPMEISKLVQEKLKIVQDEELDLGTRADAAEELGHFGDKKTAPVLIALLPKSNGTLFFEIVVALGNIRNVDVLPDLLALQKKPAHRPGQSNSALYYTVFVLQKEKARMEENLKTVADDNLGPSVRVAAARELAKMAAKISAVPLSKSLLDTDGILFLEIVVALGEIENPEVLPDLVRLQDEPRNLPEMSRAALNKTIERLTQIKKGKR